MVLTQFSSVLIHIRLVPIVIRCLFRVTKKLRVMQYILVKSDEFENLYPLLYILLKVARNSF